MSDDEPLVVREFIEYLYTGNYNVVHRTAPRDQNLPVTPLDEPLDSFMSGTSDVELAGSISEDGIAIRNHGERLLLHTKMYILADKYDVEKLKTISASKYEALVEKGSHTPEFCEAAELLWQNTADDDWMLRDIVIRITLQRINVLLEKEEFLDLMPPRGGFAMDILETVLHQLGKRTLDRRAPG
jgi:hypothetical protein